MLYKFMNKEWADKFMDTGSLRIGTLYDFRRAEHKPGVSDEHEGFSYSQIEIRGGKSFSDMTNIEKRNFGLGSVFPNELLGDFTGGEVIGDFSGQFIWQSKDMYVMCFSTTPDLIAMKKMGYDTCIEIKQHDIFINRITRALRNMAGPLMHSGLVDYSGKETNYDVIDRRFPFMTKHAEFEYQNEFRAVWEPNKQSPLILTHQIISIPNASRLCRVITQ
ncbi:hypothetical protein LLQ46_22710 [Rouxiella badensis]|uniref:hypothetical protein n=1 Tax=Rouxiella badensis TaxID=1646377 RepID=UPI001B76AD56|nr:hypothetical protein [Rouxiella badensis]MCC3749673.1 hypothetical protein [Rouxiella badensis]